jgi:type VI secretion system secreted protein Hcp
MAEYFMNIKGVRQGQFKGDNPNLIGRADWIAGIGFTMQLTQPVSEPSGAPSGRRTYKPIQITKQWGAASPQILQALATGEVLNPVIFEFTRTTPDGKEQVFQRVTLTNALVIDVKRSLDFTARHQIETATMELEEFQLTFQRITIEDMASGTIFTDDWSATT